MQLFSDVLNQSWKMYTVLISYIMFTITFVNVRAKKPWIYLPEYLKNQQIEKLKATS